MNFTKLRLFLLNCTGTLYTIITIFAIAVFNLYFTCPDLYQDCCWQSVYAFVILLQIGVNLFLFHYYNRRNQIQFWTSKSVWLLGDCNFLEKRAVKALNGNFVENNFNYSKRKESTAHIHNPVHGIKNFTRYNICQDGTYVDLKTELNGASNANDGPLAEENNSSTKYCNECKMLTPRRCQHCPICGICVLRKDHHCFLLGGCAGLANQRYFIVFLFWSALGAVYGTMFNFSYLNKHVAPWFPFGWVFYLGPVALSRWALGYEQLSHALLAVLFSISVVSALSAIGFFTFQMLYTLSGYTMYDFHRSGSTRMERDGDNYQERLALVFGRRWWFNFLLPQFWIPNQMNEKIAKNIYLSVSKDL